MVSTGVIIITSDAETSQALEGFFSKRGVNYFAASGFTTARKLIQQYRPELIFVDLHLKQSEWLDSIDFARKESPESKIIVTNKYPDVHRELLARQHGASAFLRSPFSPAWVERAIGQESKAPRHHSPGTTPNVRLPRVKVPMRVKITFPFVFLALVFAFASAVLVSRYVIDSLKERFLAQLVDTGRLASDWMVNEENRLLETLRLITNVQDLAARIENSEAIELRNLVLPIAINSNEEAVEVLNLDGISLLSYLHSTGDSNEFSLTEGDSTFAELGFVSNVLAGDFDEYGDKYSGIATISNREFFFVGGPVFTNDNKLKGAILVGTSLQNLVKRIRQDTLAHVSLYGLDGRIKASTWLNNHDSEPISQDLLGKVLTLQDAESSLREVAIASATYSEILAPWEVRHGNDIGIIGTSLAHNYFTNSNLLTRFQIFIFVILAVFGVVVLGFFLANQITNPLSQMVQAAIEVARGNLEVKITSRSNDETMVLAHAFNYMVSGLQEGFIYRDLLGRTVSPEIREALRQSFASGNLKLEGHNTVATVLMSDVRGFTTLAEKEEPTTILKWLNEYFAEIVPIITSYGGVIDKYEGDSMLAFFGILPTPLSEGESAHRACQAALEMLAVIEKINSRRSARSEPLFLTGIGVNTGTLIAGGLGTADRMNYTVIGDTVNATQRIQSVSSEFGESGVVISESTLLALRENRNQFEFTPMGEYFFKGKREAIWLYRLFPLGSMHETLNEAFSEIWEQSI